MAAVSRHADPNAPGTYAPARGFNANYSAAVAVVHSFEVEAALLAQGVCVSLVDLVSVRQANLYAELMERVARFADAQKLLGGDGNGLANLGIAFSGERTLGNSERIMLRFTGQYMQMAADKAL